MNMKYESENWIELLTSFFFKKIIENVFKGM